MKPVRLLLGLLLAGAVARAQLRPGLLESLVRDSPFLPAPGGALPAAVDSPAPFEFRGVVAEPGGYFFSVYDPSRREADWVQLDEPGRPFVVRHFDPAKDTLTIEHDGQPLTLTLQRARVQPLAPPPPTPASPPPLPTTPAAAPAAGNAPPPSANTTNAQEAQRLQQVADEIRRRRALRRLPPADKPPGQP